MSSARRTRRRDVRVDLLPDGLQVLRCLGIRVVLVLEVVRRLGAVRFGLKEVVELQTELLGELPDLRVSLVYELAAVLGDLVLGELPTQRPAAPADPVRGLMTWAV